MKNGHPHKKSRTISLAVLAGMAPLAIDVGIQVKNGDIKQAGQVLVHNLVGYNPWTNKFDIAGLYHGLFPIAAGAAVHKVAGMLGLNRMIASAGIPLVRI
jgi:hypothetical protein